MMYFLLRRLVVPRAFRKIRTIAHVERVPTDSAFVLVANHVSWLDPVYLTAAIGRRFRKRILFIAATGKHAWTQAVIPIDRKNPSACLVRAAGYLRRGLAVGIFPRGDQRLASPTKTGAARLARSADATLLPVAIVSNSTGHTLRSILEYFRGRKSIEIRVGMPFRLSRVDTITHDQLVHDTALIDQAIERALATP